MIRLRITDPTGILFDQQVRSVRAEDASGGFGILPGHADFLTALEVSVVSWRLADGSQGHCAIRNGILTMQGGNELLIATREGHLGNDLAELDATVLNRYRQRREVERTGRTAAARMRMQAIRRMVEALQGGPKEIGL